MSLVKLILEKNLLEVAENRGFQLQLPLIGVVTVGILADFGLCVLKLLLYTENLFIADHTQEISLQKLGPDFRRPGNSPRNRKQSSKTVSFQVSDPTFKIFKRIIK